MLIDIIENETESAFTANGVMFKVVRSDYYSHKTTPSEIVILKGAPFMRSYDPIFADAPVRNVLEFGIFEGGSIICFALAHPTFRFLGIDIRSPDDAVLRHIHDLGLADRVKLYYETNQADHEAVERIISNEFGSDGIGLIIDDASHDYRLSRRTFEIAFRLLANGGMYSLEDWAWAHWGGSFQTTQWVDKPALTNLVFEILMLMPSVPGMVQDIRMTPGAVYVRRGPRAIDRLVMDNALTMRGAKLALI